MKHTPGKWETWGGGLNVRTVVGQDFVALCGANGYPPENMVANARLIASAPELLQQCKNTLRQIKQVYIKGDTKTEGLCLSIKGLRGVIAKAEGK
jgi:hypothetical protein